MKVSGLSINDIVNMSIEDFNSLGRKELAQVTSRLASAANKRLARAEKAGISTPATIGAERSGGTFSVAGKNLNQVRAEFARARDFLQNKTSTRAGYARFKKEFEQKTGVDYTGMMSDENKSRRFWAMIDRMKAQDPNFFKINYKEINEKAWELAQDPTLDQESAWDALFSFKQELYEENELDLDDDFYSDL